MRPHDAPVFGSALLADQLEGLEPGQKASNIRLGSDHAGSDRGARQAFWMCAAKNPKHIVLGCCNAPGARGLLHRSLKAVSGAQQIQQRLFFNAAEGTLLGDFALEI